jgi:signal transduction histidine kinase
MTASAAVRSHARGAAAAPTFATLVGNRPPWRQVPSRESTLLATVAHELRTPLASLRLSLDMLVGEFDDLPAETAFLLIQRAQRSVAFLNGLVENLTSVTAAQAGHLDVRPTTVDVNACIEEAIAIVHALVSQRRQTVRLHCSADASLARGDRARIVQVVANLLGNASRYSIEGDAIDVRVTGTAHHVRVRVSDHGPGISPEDQQRIFSAWERCESATAGGLGLGLSIVQNLVQQLGGRVGVESTLGQGATFWFTLPSAE